MSKDCLSGCKIKIFALMSNFINYLNSTVHYITFGSGDELLFAFHGYGKNAESLQVLEPSLEKKYTVISVDIFFHGLSKWEEGRRFTPEDLRNIILQFCDELGYNGRFSVLGYSIGARYLQCVLGQLPERINTLWVLAGDGLAGYSLYNIATRTVLGKRIFRSFIAFPWPIFLAFKTLKALKMVEPNVYSFVQRKVDTKDKRLDLYRRWLSMAYLQIPASRFIKLCNQYDIQVNFIYGKHDNVTPYKAIIPLTKKLEHKNCQVIDEGHGLISAKLNEVIKLL